MGANSTARHVINGKRGNVSSDHHHRPQRKQWVISRRALVEYPSRLALFFVPFSLSWRNIPSLARNRQPGRTEKKKILIP